MGSHLTVPGTRSSTCRTSTSRSPSSAIAPGGGPPDTSVQDWGCARSRRIPAHGRNHIKQLNPDVAWMWLVVVMASAAIIDRHGYAMHPGISQSVGEVQLQE